MWYSICRTVCNGQPLAGTMGRRPASRVAHVVDVNGGDGAGDLFGHTPRATFAHAGENLCWLDLCFRSQAHAFGAPLCGFGLRGAVEPAFIVPLMKFVECSEAALQLDRA